MQGVSTATRALQDTANPLEHANRRPHRQEPRPMPTFQFEAMDHTGKEVKDTIDASTQEEAQQLIRQRGFFVTKISERAAKKKSAKAAQAKKTGRKRKKTFTIGKISSKQLTTFTRQLSTL